MGAPFFVDPQEVSTLIGEGADRTQTGQPKRSGNDMPFGARVANVRIGIRFRHSVAFFCTRDGNRMRGGPVASAVS